MVEDAIETLCLDLRDALREKDHERANAILERIKQVTASDLPIEEVGEIALRIATKIMSGEQN